MPAKKRKTKHPALSHILITSLPLDVLWNIFDYLPVCDLLRFSATCKGLEEMVYAYLHRLKAKKLYLTGERCFLKNSRKKPESWTSTERLRICRNWTLGESRMSQVNNCKNHFRIAIDQEYLYCSRLGRMRRYARIESRISKEFKSVTVDPDDYITAMAVNEGRVFGGTLKGRCFIVKDNYGQKPKIMEGYRKIVSVDMNWYNNIFLVSSTYKNLSIKRINEMGKLYTKHLIQKSAQVVRLDPSGSYFLAADLGLDIINLHTMKLVRGTAPCVRCCIFDAVWHSKVILAGGYDTNLLLFDSRTMHLVQRYVNSQGRQSVALSSINSIQYDGNFGVLCCNRRRVNLFDLRMAKSVVTSYTVPKTDRSEIRQLAADTKNLFISTEREIYHYLF